MHTHCVPKCSCKRLTYKQRELQLAAGVLRRRSVPDRVLRRRKHVHLRGSNLWVKCALRAATLGRYTAENTKLC